METCCWKGLGDAGARYENFDEAPVRTDAGDVGGGWVIPLMVLGSVLPVLVMVAPTCMAYTVATVELWRAALFVVATGTPPHLRRWARLVSLPRWRSKGHGLPRVMWVEIKQAIGLAPNEIIRR